MRKNNSIIKKLSVLQRDEIFIGNHLIKGISSDTWKGEALTKMHCDFEGFSIRFAQNEFLSGSDGKMHVNILVNDFLNVSNEEFRGIKHVFSELQTKHLQDELEMVTPTFTA